MYLNFYYNYRTKKPHILQSVATYDRSNRRNCLGKICSHLKNSCSSGVF